MALQEHEPNLSREERSLFVLQQPTATRMLPEGYELATGASANRIWQFGEPTQTLEPEVALEREFRRLRDTWRNDTMFVSSATVITNHWAYQRIIALGSGVVPLIVEELRNGTNHWFFALHQLTGYTPPPVNHGNMRKMREAWLRWADENLKVQAQNYAWWRGVF